MFKPGLFVALLDDDPLRLCPLSSPWHPRVLKQVSVGQVNLFFSSPFPLLSHEVYLFAVSSPQAAKFLDISTGCHPIF